jgi:hypothetical protein
MKKERKKMTATMKKASLLILLAVLLLATGCNKLTMENYDRLRLGMEYTEVVSLLGKPDNCSEAMGVRSCVWGGEKKNITVLFLGETATFFTHTGLK